MRKKISKIEMKKIKIKWKIFSLNSLMLSKHTEFGKEISLLANMEYVRKLWVIFNQTFRVGSPSKFYKNHNNFTEIHI